MRYIDSTWVLGGPIADDDNLNRIVDEDFLQKLDYAIESGLFIYGCAGTTGNPLGAVARIDSIEYLGDKIFFVIEPVVEEEKLNRLIGFEMSIIADPDDMPYAIYFYDPDMPENVREFMDQDQINLVVNQLKQQRKMFQMMINDAVTTPPENQIKFVNGRMETVRLPLPVEDDYIFGRDGDDVEPVERTFDNKWEIK